MAEIQDPLLQALQRAQTFHDAGNLLEAEKLYRYIVEEKSDHFEALYMLGIIEYQRGRDTEAVRHIDQALAIKPNYPEALYNRGYILAASQRYQEALESYDRALAVEPMYAAALYNRGNVLAALNRLPE